jgi:tRNA threonylcarbamoyladenosine biosynthesis protein TsaE
VEAPFTVPRARSAPAWESRLSVREVAGRTSGWFTSIAGEVIRGIKGFPADVRLLHRVAGFIPAGGHHLRARRGARRTSFGRRLGATGHSMSGSTTPTTPLTTEGGGRLSGRPPLIGPTGRTTPGTRGSGGRLRGRIIDRGVGELFLAGVSRPFVQANGRLFLFWQLFAILYLMKKEVPLPQLGDYTKEFIEKLKAKDEATIVGLYGNLGSGKTTFTKELAKQLGVVEEVTSPTFTLFKEYKLTDQKFNSLIHIDLYRIDSWEDANILNLENVFKQPGALVLIEWVEKLGTKMNKAMTKVYFESDRLRGNSRIIEVLYE